MFTLAANLGHVGFDVHDGQAFAAQSVHKDKTAAAIRVKERKAEGHIAWARKRGVLK